MFTLINITAKEKKKQLEKLRPLTILLVEDNLLNAKLVAVLFAQQGLSLQLAANGQEAIEKIRSTPVDLVLMDMEMPVMNGYQATSIIRQQLKSTIPIIALTAHSLPGEKEKCIAYGMTDYVVKPLDPDQLFTSMYQAVYSSKLPAAKKREAALPATVAALENVCNMNYLLKVTRGNKKNINYIVSVFFKETQKELTCLNKAIEKTNYPLIGDISHKIKSAFFILGIKVLDQVFTELELLSSNPSTVEKIKQLNSRINIVFKQARAEMKAYQ